jgi:acetyl-CoA carboxylase carboxyl transferase subunit alpha
VRLIDDWTELHGDRARADDPAVVAGIGRFHGRTVAVIGHQKGRDIQERVHRNFGMAHPEGYRKAMRVMELAERFGFPLITLIDTPGAYPGLAAEQHGQGGMIARCQATMARLRVPTAACVIGEGGSGGAVAFAVADRVYMQQHAIYSVISPEGCAQILWRDGAEAPKAAAAMKPDARHCLELGVIDDIVPEPRGGAHMDWEDAAFQLGEMLRRGLAEVDELGPDERRALRRAKFRAMGTTA